MIKQLSLGFGVTVATFVVHAIALALIGPWARGRAETTDSRTVSGIIVIVGVVIGLLVAMSVEIAIWAAALLVVGIFPDLETAGYFSVVSFTTLGYGDVVLEKGWRLLSGLIAIDGLLIIGWSTAFLVNALQPLRRSS